MTWPQSRRLPQHNLFDFIKRSSGIASNPWVTFTFFFNPLLPASLMCALSSIKSSMGRTNEPVMYTHRPRKIYKIDEDYQEITVHVGLLQTKTMMAVRLVWWVNRENLFGRRLTIGPGHGHILFYILFRWLNKYVVLELACVFRTAIAQRAEPRRPRLCSPIATAIQPHSLTQWYDVLRWVPPSSFRS